MKFLLFVTILIFSGCFQRSAFVKEKPVTNENIKVGHIDRYAPIITVKKKEHGKPFFIPQESIENKQQIASSSVVEKELVGYIVDSNYDQDVRLYYYTLTNALRSKKIHFFSDRSINYPSTKLVRVQLKGNYLKSISPYHTILKKRKKSWINTAKEYFIKVK